MKEHLEWAINHKRPWYKTAESVCIYILVAAAMLSCLITYFFGP